MIVRKVTNLNTNPAHRRITSLMYAATQLPLSQSAIMLPCYASFSSDRFITRDYFWPFSSCPIHRVQTISVGHITAKWRLCGIWSDRAVVKYQRRLSWIWIELQWGNRVVLSRLVSGRRTNDWWRSRHVRRLRGFSSRRRRSRRSTSPSDWLSPSLDDRPTDRPSISTTML